MSFDECVIKYNQIKNTLDDSRIFRDRFGGNKKILVPKVEILGSSDDGFKRLMIFSSLEHERFDKRRSAELLGYTSHARIEQNKAEEFDLGTAGLFCSGNLLGRFTRVDFSDKLRDALRRKNVVPVFALGNRNYLCIDGQFFGLGYKEILNDLGVVNNL